MKLLCATSLTLCAVLALGACKKNEDQPRAAAGGELLPRSASDAMLPYDTVRSQASISVPTDAVIEDIPRSRGPLVMETEVPDDTVVPDEPVVAVDPGRVPPAP